VLLFSFFGCSNNFLIASYLDFRKEKENSFILLNFKNLLFEMNNYLDGKFPVYIKYIFA